jgi:hypothetical protein
VKPENEGQPHLPRRGWLKNGNSPGDFTKAPRCGAKNRKGYPCPQPAMRNGKCRFHGGKSTGSQSLEGMERMRQSKFKHGRYSKEMKAASQYLKTFRATLASLKKDASRR